MNEEESDLNMHINDVNSDILSKKGLNLTKKAKIIIGISVALIVIITIIIILIIALSNKNNENDNENDNKEDNDKINPDLITAEIICNYHIETSSKEMNILGAEFILDNNHFDIIREI